MKTRSLVSFISIILGISLVVSVFIFTSHYYVAAEGVSSYAQEFADMQEKHIKAAKQHGSSAAPYKDRAGISHVDDLIKVRSCRTFKVQRMEHGLPYLTAAAKAELERIAQDFRDSCKAKALPVSRLIVTSMLRTEEDVIALKGNNQNAVINSAHLYGTTMDISWAFYQCPNKRADGQAYLSILAEVLRQHRKEGSLLVRHERSQRCFHITVNK